MKKKIVIAVITMCMFLLFGTQLWIVRDFSGNADRAEIFGMSAEQMERLSGQYRTEYLPDEHYGVVYDDGQSFFLQKLTEMLRTEVTVCYIPGNRILRQFPKLTCWLWGCLVIFIFGCLMVYSVKKAMELYYLEKENLYFRQWLEKHMVGILAAVVSCCVMVVIGLFLLRWLISCQFYLPGEFLPPNFILDFSFYKEQLAVFNNIPETEYRNAFRKCFFGISVVFLAEIPLSMMTVGFCIRYAIKE